MLEGVRVSVPERAVLEMLYEVGKSQDMEEAKNIDQFVAQQVNSLSTCQGNGYKDKVISVFL